MAFNYNKTILGGTLVRDPEIKTVGDSTLCKFCVAVNRKSKTAEEVSFIDVTAWDKKADAIGQYFRKGQSILLEGRLKQENWTDKASGQKRSKLGVVLESFSFIGPKKDGEPPAEDVPDDDEYHNP